MALGGVSPIRGHRVGDPDDALPPLPPAVVAADRLAAVEPQVSPSLVVTAPPEPPPVEIPAKKRREDTAPAAE